MTSTQYRIGLESGERSSSKILKPPGGGSSDIFGTTSAQENSARAAEYKIKNAGNDTSSRIFGLLESQETPRKVKNYLKSTIFQEQVKPQDPIGVDHGGDEGVETIVDGIKESKVELNNDASVEAVFQSTDTPVVKSGDCNSEIIPCDVENDAASSATKRSGLGNPITGEGYKAEDIETEKCIRHPQVRVRNPPGGPSTKLW